MAEIIHGVRKTAANVTGIHGALSGKKDREVKQTPEERLEVDRRKHEDRLRLAVNIARTQTNEGGATRMRASTTGGRGGGGVGCRGGRGGRGGIFVPRQSISPPRHSQTPPRPTASPASPAPVHRRRSQSEDYTVSTMFTPLAAPPLKPPRPALGGVVVSGPPPPPPPKPTRPFEYKAAAGEEPTQAAQAAPANTTEGVTSATPPAAPEESSTTGGDDGNVDV